jgi:hypothetical protein
VERKGKVVLIVPESPIKQQRVFKKRKLLVNPDEDITQIDWMSEWRKNNGVPEAQFNKKKK